MKWCMSSNCNETSCKHVVMFKINKADLAQPSHQTLFLVIGEGLGKRLGA